MSPFKPHLPIRGTFCMVKRSLIILSFLAVIGFIYLLAPRPESSARIIPHEEVLNRNLGHGIQYWLNNNEILMQDDEYANGELKGCKFSRYNLETKKKEEIPGLADKLGKLVIRWQLSPDKTKLLAVAKQGDKPEYVVINLDGTQMVRVPVTYPGEYYCAWLADSKGWIEIQERTKDKKNNVIFHALDGKEIPPRQTMSTIIYEMRLRQYASLFSNNNWLEVPYMEAGMMGLGPLHLQLKGFKDPTVPIKEFALTVPKDMHLSAFTLSPDRTQMAWITYSEKGGGPEGSDYAQRILITNLDTKKTVQITNEPINLDIATKQDPDRDLLLTWSPDGKKLAYCLNGEFRTIDYAGVQGTPSPASAALPIE